MKTKSWVRDRKESAACMSRRGFIGLVAATGALISIPLELFASGNGLPTLIEATEGKTADGKTTYSLITKTDKQNAIRALAQPGKLSFSVSPIRPEESVPLLTLPPKDPSNGNLSEDEKTIQQAATQLLNVSGSFVAPRSVELKGKSVDGVVVVCFMFMGEKDPNRRIKVTLVLKGNAGTVLKEMTETCVDQRVLAKQAEGRNLRGRARKLSRANLVRFEFDKNIASSIQECETVFSES